MGRKGSVIDLGAGHCIFTRDAHALGWQATALDVRIDRRPDLPDGVSYIHANVNSDDWDPSQYDVIACLGLYYHLDQEMQFNLLEKCRGKTMIIDTHFANEDNSKTIGGLSDLTIMGEEQGAIFKEAPGSSVVERKETRLLASYENSTSWWPTRDSLKKTLHRFGFEHVWELASPCCDTVQRTFFIAYSTKPF